MERHSPKGRILLAGAGGLGNFVLFLLLPYKLDITVVDPDVIERSNLHRQLLFREEDVGKYKVKVLEERFGVEGLVGDVREVDVTGFDVVIDATDNWKVKMDLLRNCLSIRIPYILLSAGEGKGLVSVPQKELFISPRSSRSVSVTELSVTSGIGVEEAIKILEGKRPTLLNKVLVFDLNSQSFHVFDL